MGWWRLTFLGGKFVRGLVLVSMVLNIEDEIVRGDGTAFWHTLIEILSGIRQLRVSDE